MLNELEKNRGWKMKVYISGKITGDADYKQKFKTAQNILESVGFKVFNPAELKDTGKSWSWYMRKDIAGLMECDAIFLLKDWEDSKGARLEYYIAQQLEMKIFRESVDHEPYKTLNVGDKIKIDFNLPGKKGLYPVVNCKKESVTLINKTDYELLFVTDRVIFNGPIDTNNCKEYAKTELAQYLDNDVKESLNAAMGLLGKITEVRLLSVGEVFGASDYKEFAACTDERLKYFKKRNHRIVFDKAEDYSRWWWLSTPTKYESAAFCHCRNLGNASCNSADNSYGGVRFAFLIQNL